MKADWNAGVWSGEATEPGERTARLTFGADWLPLRAFERVIAENPLAVYGDLLPVLRSSDLNVVNVETTLGFCGEPIPKAGPNFRAREETVMSLTDVPFHVALMANNHIMDYGPDSLNHTIRVLREAGMTAVGAGMNGREAAEPALLDVKGIRVAIVNCAEGEACRSVDGGPGAHGFEKAAAAAQIKELKQRADHVIAVFHGGREYAPMPPEYVVDGLRAMAEAGASAVIAHHPHVPQGIEVYRGVPIVYSQGNFVFWQDNDLFYTHSGYLVHLDVGKRHICRMEITPYVIGEKKLSRMTGELKRGFLQSLQTVSRLLDDPEAVRAAWEAFVDAFGLDGMVRAIERTLADMSDISVEVGSARLHNLFFTPAHSELFLNGLKRASSGKLGRSPEWAQRLVRHWQTFTVNDALAKLGNDPAGGGYLQRLLDGGERETS